MRRGYGLLTVCGVLLGGLAGAAPGAAEPDCAGGVEVRPVTLTVDGEQATGRVYEPYRCAPGDQAPRDLIVAVHGHGGSSADYAGYLTSIVRRTGAPALSMDVRGATSVWRTGDWNMSAAISDIPAATRWYRDSHPSIARTVLWGWSQGGTMSGLAAAYAPPGLFDYWVDNFGPADDFSMWALSGAIDPTLPAQIERDAGGCTPLVCPAAYAQRSPALLAGRMTVRRAFLIHGTADTVVPFAASVQMRAALLAAGKPTSMYTIVTGRDLHGAVAPGDHSVGPAFFEGGCVVERLVTGREPLDGGDHDYLVDIAHGIAGAPAAPPGAKCAA